MPNDGKSGSPWSDMWRFRGCRHHMRGPLDGDMTQQLRRLVLLCEWVRELGERPAGGRHRPDDARGGNWDRQWAGCVAEEIERDVRDVYGEPACDAVLEETRERLIQASPRQTPDAGGIDTQRSLDVHPRWPWRSITVLEASVLLKTTGELTRKSWRGQCYRCEVPLGGCFRYFLGERSNAAECQSVVARLFSLEIKHWRAWLTD